MHTNAIPDSAIALMISPPSDHKKPSGRQISIGLRGLPRRPADRPPRRMGKDAAPIGAASFCAGRQYALRRTATPRGATTTAPAGRTAGAATTAAPPAATQPARTTPRAQTTALASKVLKAMKLPASSV